MATVWEGGGEKTFDMKLKGDTVIVENSGVFDGNFNFSYRRETILHFKNEEEASEYYYVKKHKHKKDKG